TRLHPSERYDTVSFHIFRNPAPPGGLRGHFPPPNTPKGTPVTTATALPAAGSHGGVVLDAARRRKILAAMCLALMAVIASVSILNVAQQDLALDLGASQGTVLWILNAYTLA